MRRLLLARQPTSKLVAKRPGHSYPRDFICFHPSATVQHRTPFRGLSAYCSFSHKARLTMRTLCSLTCLAALVLAAGAPVRADDNDKTKPILDKAIKALGGEERL